MNIYDFIEERIILTGDWNFNTLKRTVLVEKTKVSDEWIFHAENSTYPSEFIKVELQRFIK